MITNFENFGGYIFYYESGFFRYKSGTTVYKIENPIMNMIFQNEQKLPTVFDNLSANRQKRNRQILAVFLIIILFLLLSFFIFYDKESKTSLSTLSNEKSSTNISKLPDYPSTQPAHLDANFEAWSIPAEAKSKLWDAVKNSPINEKTGRHCIIYSVANEGMIDFILNSLCSMKLVGIPRNYHVTIALDQESYDAISKIDEPVIYLKSNFTKQAVNNRKLIDFYNIIKVKPTILHQFLLWNVEPILVDVDSVFLQNPFHVFNDEADFEVQCDSKIYYQIPYNEYPVPWQVNLGFFKVHPTKTVMKLMPFWLTRMYNASKVHDQSSLRKVLKPYPTFWINNDTISVDARSLIEDDQNLTFRFLDPMLIANAGGLYQDGKRNWKKEAKRRKITRPEFIHFFHCGSVGEKLGYMKKNKLWFINQTFQCLSEQPEGAVTFKVWK